MKNYLLGLFTIPVILGVGFLLVLLYWKLSSYLDTRWGISWEAKLGRGVENLLADPYTLQHEIWFERARGPVFYGHWVHERRYKERVHRWVGFGSRTGPCVMFFRKFDLKGS